ncbi:hypothetical protein ACFE04_007160 [Oxalis oulophora]
MSMMFQLNSVVVAVVVALLIMLIENAECMMLDLQSGVTKCITEDIKENSMTVGKYNIINPNEASPLPDTHRLTVRVSSPHGNNYHYGDPVESGNFAFTAAESGDYTTCFFVRDHKPQITVTIEFDWRTGIAAKDWSKVARKGQIDTMEAELNRLNDIVQSIHDEMFYLREREEEMQLLNRSTNSKMASLSFLSLVVCGSVAGFQIWHLKKFFERKKLL